VSALARYIAKYVSKAFYCGDGWGVGRKRYYSNVRVERVVMRVTDHEDSLFICGDCPSTGALIAAAVLGQTGAEHWIDIIIRMLGNIHDIYDILHDASDYRVYIADIQSIQGGDWWVISDIIDYLLDFVVFLLELPRSIVLLLKPVDDFVVALRGFLIRFRALIVSML